jgi:arabinofuranosyltransferase
LVKRRKPSIGGAGVAWLGLAAAIFLLLAASYFNYTIDDAYISLRYARNVAGGEGFAFDNRAPPVEGYTNFLWVVCEVPFYVLRVPGDAVLSAKLMGIAWGIVALAAAFLLARRLFGPGAGAVAALCIAAMGNVAFWAVGGLETAQYLCLIILALYFTLEAGRRTAAAVAAGALWCLAALARPEGFVLAYVVILSSLIMGGAGGRERRGFFVAGVVLTFAYGAYFLWRWRYFGMFLPNTFYARAGFSAASFATRVRGVLPFLAYTALPVAAAWVPGRRERNHGARLLWIALTACLVLAFVARREWMPGFRYELPFAVLAWLLFAGTWFNYIKKRRKAVAGALTAAVIMYAAIPGVFLFKEVSYTEGLDRAHVALGKWLARAAPAGSSLATWDMGALPYYSELPVIYDLNPEGLLSRETTRYGYRPEYFLSRRPTYFVLYSSEPDRVAVPPGHWTRAYYESPILADEYKYLFAFTMGRDYDMRVYVRRDVAFAPGDVATGERLARLSRRHAGR